MKYVFSLLALARDLHGHTQQAPAFLLVNVLEGLAVTCGAAAQRLRACSSLNEGSVLDAFFNGSLKQLEQFVKRPDRTHSLSGSRFTTTVPTQHI